VRALALRAERVARLGRVHEDRRAHLRALQVAEGQQDELAAEVDRMSLPEMTTLKT